jgi:hypothetical protein
MQLGFFFPTLKYLLKIQPTKQKKVKFTIEKIKLNKLFFVVEKMTKNVEKNHCF